MVAIGWRRWRWLIVTRPLAVALVCPQGALVTEDLGAVGTGYLRVDIPNSRMLLVGQSWVDIGWCLCVWRLAVAHVRRQPLDASADLGTFWARHVSGATSRCWLANISRANCRC